ncbi:glycosyltransferase family 4 protein [Photobacterium leiognathi]|uniref:glycosyltransferase family 4 protein n=1 Tax=Photobacterium leiognathi TaxID=553611 RepID=UPI002982258E|nr:glycosyltransferase family 1 protein [Photobacterium leiognathi]
MIILDCRLVSKSETGISRFSIENANRFVEKFGKDKIILLVNEKNDKLIGVQKLTKLKPFNLIHFFIFSFFIYILNPEKYISFQYSGLWFKRDRTQCSITIHDLMYRIVDDFFKPGFQSLIGIRYYDLIVKYSLLSSDNVFSVSQTTKDDLLSMFGYNSIICSEGVNNLFSKISIDSEISNDKYGNGYFLYVGNCRPHKGISDFLYAYKAYRKLGGERNLVLVGSGHNVASDGVTCTGVVSDKELYFLYKNAYAFIFPSKYEGFGLPILEAIDSGIIVYCNSIPAFKEFNSSNIYYFDINNIDSITNLLFENHLFDDIDSKVFLSKYNWNNTFEIIYEKIQE